MLDERILGSTDFVAQVLTDTRSGGTATGQHLHADPLHDTIAANCAAAQVAVAEVLGSSKRPRLVAIRREICVRAVLRCGLPVNQVARRLRISARTVLRALERERLRRFSRRR